MWLEGAVQPASTTVTTGVIAVVQNIDPVNIVSDWANRFANTFEEYRVVKAKFFVNVFSTANPGLLLQYVDEKVATAPTAAAVNERALVRYSAADVVKPHILTWRPRDVTDLVYTPIGSPFVPAYFKIYTDNANFGSSIVATPYLSYYTKYKIQFRGLLT
jgi:hypothetical protein